MNSQESVLELQETVTKLELELQKVKAERDRYITRMQLLEKRIGFALEIFSDKLKVPTINEIRIAQGIEPL